MPELRRHTKSSSHALPHKLSSAKDKYVLKRRDPQLPFSGATVTGPSKLTPLDFPSPIQPFSSFQNIFPTAPQPSPPRPTTAVQDAAAAGDYVLQKRPPADFADDKPARQASPAPLAETRVSERKPSPSAVDVPVATAPRTDPPVSSAVADVKDGAVLARPLDAWKPGGVVVACGIPTKKKIKKRPREDGGISIPDAAGEIMKTKKKENKERSNETGLLSAGSLKRVKVEELDGKSASTFVSVGPEQPKIAEPFLSALRLPQVDLSSRNLQLPDLVGDLRELALDPYYGFERDVPAAVLHAFLKFRSLVYKKSFVLPSPAEAEAAKVQAAKPPRLPLEAIAESSEIAPAKPAKVGREPPVATKPPKPGFSPPIAGRKRTTSDRLEEMNVKKQKKMDMVKVLVGEKKAVISRKGPVGQNEAGTSSTVIAASLSSTSAPTASAKPCNAKAAEPIKNRELRVSSPTALVLKFPPQTTLPSIASLKARFARFGPLELSSFRVYWQSYTCKVVYKFKSDAEAALKYARENKMFGQLKVSFHLRDADTQAPEPFADAGWQTQESRPAEGAQFGPGNSASSGITASRPLINPNQKPSWQLKSILKKPGEDAAPSSGREAVRVKFMLDNVDGKPEPPPSHPPELVISKTTEPPTIPPPPLLSRPLLRTMDAASFPPPPLAPLQQLATNRVVHGRAEGRPIANKDLAKQMVSLMVRCSQIVNSVKSLPGYAPYRPL
ncbi:PWWP domain-containing protein 1-like [Curcuma longa]|uniref:PWWP domain-containing protein 1-like n=1 Tax=Curcuma longa TaxID=136217 RepID=UPI003D9EEFC6